jgi:hypothetical protein
LRILGAVAWNELLVKPRVKSEYYDLDFIRKRVRKSIFLCKNKEHAEVSHADAVGVGTGGLEVGITLAGQLPTASAESFSASEASCVL